MNAGQREQHLRDLAAAIQRGRLAAPAQLLLDVAVPLGVLASQVALFVQPFTPRGRWHDYVAALSDESGWRRLHELLDRDG